MKLSVVINTLNEEKNLPRALRSVRFADEVVVCDMFSDDATVEVAKKAGARVFMHERTGFVEPARNFAISKATGDWVLVLDADEEISPTLQSTIQQIVQTDSEHNFVEIPRQNLIFGRWVQASQWWPDYNIRLFKKGTVTWGNTIHHKPKTQGAGLMLEPEVDQAIVHHHYQTVNQFLERMIRYSHIQAEQLQQDGYHFKWTDLIKKPVSEFLGRFFANKGYQDGVHGLVLCLLQAVSSLALYIQVWELEKFPEQKLSLEELKAETQQAGKEFDYWFHTSRLSKNPLKAVVQKALHKLSP